MNTDDGLSRRLHALPAERLAGLRRGIEKESLRTQPDGSLALTPHPAALGSPLTHPNITTDFSESQLELITGVHAQAADCLQELQHIHQAVYRAIGDEMLWVGSMPCLLPADDAIPIGRYGTSNIGRAKTVYRTGLSHRYGRRMQTISGIHYNWSIPGATNDDYFALMRNFRRHSFCCCCCSARRRRCARASSPAGRMRCSRWRAARSGCRMPRRCAWAGSATRATRSPR
jgi:glutamate--cysteine ligase